VLQQPPAVEPATADQLVALAEPPGHGEQQSESQVSGRVGEDARGVGHGHAGGRRGRDVDVVVADRDVGHHSQARVGREHLRGHPVGQLGHHGVGACAGAGELGTFERVGRPALVDVESGVDQALDGLSVDRLGHENSHVSPPDGPLLCPDATLPPDRRLEGARGSIVPRRGIPAMVVPLTRDAR
jgi:hypothetical protein